jgi:hypothetical protein
VLIATTWPADQGEEHFSALVALQVLVTVENAITLPCYVIYTCKYIIEVFIEAFDVDILV